MDTTIFKPTTFFLVKMSNKYSPEKAKILLRKGYSYSEVAAQTNYTERSLSDANSSRWKIDYHAAFEERIEREGVSSRLNVENSFANWFVGLFDGEGCFRFRVQNEEGRSTTVSLVAKIALRDDDQNVLKQVKRRLEVGNIHNDKRDYSSARVGSKPQSVWRVGSVTDAAEVLIPLFDEYPLRSKKSNEYQHWRKGVILFYKKTRGGNGGAKGGYRTETVSKFEDISDQIRQERKYE
jgi:hypothetical protein